MQERRPFLWPEQWWSWPSVAHKQGQNWFYRVMGLPEILPSLRQSTCQMEQILVQIELSRRKVKETWKGKEPPELFCSPCTLIKMSCPPKDLEKNQFGVISGCELWPSLSLTFVFHNLWMWIASCQQNKSKFVHTKASSNLKRETLRGNIFD